MKLLKKLIKEKYGYLYKYTKVLNISRVSLSYKLNKQVPFTLAEMKIIRKDLQLTDKQVCDIFLR